MASKTQTPHQSAKRPAIHRPAQSPCKEMVWHNAFKHGFLARPSIISEQRLAEPNYIMQNKANLPGVQMNINILLKKDYENETRLLALGKQTQFHNPPNDREEKRCRARREKSF